MDIVFSMIFEEYSHSLSFTLTISFSFCSGREGRRDSIKVIGMMSKAASEVMVGDREGKGEKGEKGEREKERERMFSASASFSTSTPKKMKSCECGWVGVHLCESVRVCGCVKACVYELTFYQHIR